MKVPTVNVIIGFSKEAMRNIFLEGTSYKSLLKDAANDKDVFLFTAQGNSNILSLDHEMGKGNKITISFVDPLEEFERRFITTDVTDLVAGSMLESDEAEPDFVLSPTFNKQKEGLDAHKAFFSEYAKKFKEKFGTRQLYVAYGVGDNFDLWSGPHVVTISRINLISKGSRKFTMELVPQPRTLDFTGRRAFYQEEASLDLEGLTYEVEGRSTDMDFYKVYLGKPDPIYQSPLLKASDYAAEADAAKKGQEDALAEATDKGYKYAAAVLEKVDIHILVTDVIRDYIRKCIGNPNVIVLIPDLNKLFLETIDEIAKIEGRAGSLILDEPSTAPQGPFSAPIDWEQSYISSDKKYLALYNTISSVLTKIGLELNSFPKDPVESYKSTDPAYTQHEHERNFGTYEEHLKHFLSNNYFYGSLRQTESQNGFPDHTKTLKDVLNSVFALSKGFEYSKFTPAALYESDTNLIKVWALARKENNLFGGPGRKISDERAVFIWGDRRLIKDYLYGELKGEGNIPIHPVDEASLGISYRNTIKKKLKKKSVGAGAFGDVAYIPEDFAYVDEDLPNKAELEKLLKENNIPVLRYNTQSPNVLSMNFKFAGAYLTELLTAFTKEMSKKATANFAGLFKDKYANFEMSSPEEIVAYIRSRHYSLGHSEEDKQKIIEELSTKFANLAEEANVDPEDEAKFAYALYESILARPDNPIIKIDQLLPGNPIVGMVDMAEQLYRQALQLEVTTLPMFHLSNANTIGKTALLLAQDVPIKQGRTPKNTLLNKFYSGFYIITGFRHTISGSKAETTLSLTKSVVKATNPKYPTTPGDVY